MIPSMMTKTNHADACHATIEVDDVVRVRWSNGHGYSDYRVVDNPGSGPHLFVLLRNRDETQSREEE